MTVDLDALEALDADAKIRLSGKLMAGTAGGADLVAYDGSDITGIASFHHQSRVRLVAEVCNALPELIRLARIGQRVERDAKKAQSLQLSRSVE